MCVLAREVVDFRVWEVALAFRFFAALELALVREKRAAGVTFLEALCHRVLGFLSSEFLF